MQGSSQFPGFLGGGSSMYLKPCVLALSRCSRQQRARAKGPPLSTRYRGQTLLCLASGLTSCARARARTRWAFPEPGGVAGRLGARARARTPSACIRAAWPTLDIASTSQHNTRRARERVPGYLSRGSL